MPDFDSELPLEMEPKVSAREARTELLRLVEAVAKAACPTREMEDGVLAILSRLETEPDRMATEAETEALAARIAGDWTSELEQLAAREHGALPLHATAIYLWMLRPDGEILVMDHEAFRRPVDREDDPLVRFAVMVQRARREPFLADRIPSPPAETRPCWACRTDGVGPDGLGCLACRGLGWRSG